jgi:hypothetical protein
VGRCEYPGGFHFGGRFCQVSSLSCVFSSSLKWSKVEGPVPVIHQYHRSRCDSTGNILPSPFLGSMSGILLILRYTLCTARLNPGLRMSFATAQACKSCQGQSALQVYDAHTSKNANQGAMAVGRLQDDIQPMQQSTAARCRQFMQKCRCCARWWRLGGMGRAKEDGRRDETEAAGQARPTAMAPAI